MVDCCRRFGGWVVGFCCLDFASFWFNDGCGCGRV